MGSSYYRGRVAVITGAGSGIGRALAVRLAREGALLALLDRDGPAAEATARQCQDAGTRARAAVVDVTDREALGTCAAAAVAEFGRIDLVCCAAGVMHTGTVLASAWDDTARVVRVNLLGTMGTVAAFLPPLLASGGGHVVLCSSGFGLLGAARYTAYCASKFAVRGFSEALRMEMALGGHDVQVTCAYPGVRAAGRAPHRPPRLTRHLDLWAIGDGTYSLPLNFLAAGLRLRHGLSPRCYHGTVLRSLLVRGEDALAVGGAQQEAEPAEVVQRLGAHVLGTGAEEAGQGRGEAVGVGLHPACEESKQLLKLHGVGHFQGHLHQGVSCRPRGVAAMSSASRPAMRLSRNRLLSRALLGYAFHPP